MHARRRHGAPSPAPEPPPPPQKLALTQPTVVVPISAHGTRRVHDELTDLRAAFDRLPHVWAVNLTPAGSARRRRAELRLAIYDAADALRRNRRERSRIARTSPRYWLLGIRAAHIRWSLWRLEGHS